MNTTTKFFALVLVVVSLFVASIAAADAFSLTVRITDASAVERELGTCDSGYYVLGVVDGRTRSYGFGRDGTVTISTRNVHTPPYLQLACAGVGRGMPSGVEVTTH